MAPPSATLDGTFNGITPLTSGASDIDIPQSILLICYAAFMIYNIAFLFIIELPAIANFTTTIPRTLLDWLNTLHQHITTARAPNPQATFHAVTNFTVQIYNASRNKITSTYGWITVSTALHVGLSRMISKPYKRPNRTILVDAVAVPGAGALALIRGLPSDILAPELHRSLESILFIHYASQLRNRSVDHDAVQRNAIREAPQDTENVGIDTSGPGLWRGACIRSEEAGDTAETSTSGIATPRSETWVSDMSAVGGASRALAGSMQELASSSRRS